MSCLADAQLSALLDGTLPSQELPALEAHVATCEDCAVLVGHLGALNAAGPTLVGGRYRVESLLGRGGMGEVWAAYDPELDRQVAIKLIRAQLGDSGAKRLVREARALARLQDPNVVAVYDVGESDGEMFVVTELVDGETMATWQRGREQSEVVRAYLQAASGLAAAHREGLVHRDVKPTNLFIGSGGRVKVGDFGLAIAAGAPNAGAGGSCGVGAGSRVTAAGRVAGTAGYMAPEQRAGAEADARADQFSLTVSLVEAISGERPAAGASSAELSSCGALAPVLARALADSPTDRYESMTAWADAIEAAEEASTGVVPRRSWWLPALVASTVAIAAVVAVLTVRAKTASRPSPAAAPASASSTQISAIDAADRALRVGDSAACLAAIASAGPVGGRDHERATVIAARCEMLAGQCSKGSERLRTLTADDAYVASEAKAHCPTDRGDIATRVSRLYTQVSMFAMQRRFGCGHYRRAALAAARDAGLAGVARGRAELASVINNLAECYSKADQCDRASALLEAGRSHKLDVLAEISGCSR